MGKLGLPASIEAGESSHGVPESVWTKVMSIQSAGGVMHLTDTIQHADNTKDESNNILNQVMGIILEEENEDFGCRQKYGSRWDRVDSKTLNQSLKDTCNRYQTLIQDAAKSDEG